MIIWYNQKELAKYLGMSVNHFKENYREQYPPNRKQGIRIYWSGEYAKEIADKLSAKPV